MTTKNSTINELQDELSSVLNLLKKLNVDDVDQSPHRVIHLKNNPHQMEMRERGQELADLKKDNERLRARLKLLEAGNDANVTRHIDDAVNTAHQVETLKKKVSEFQKREEKILDSFKKTSRGFREACYYLIGYRVDALKDGIYRLSSIYAANEDDKLLFKVERDGTIQLLHNEYSETLSEYVNTYIATSDSIPAFLSSITLDLFKSTTQLGQMSMCMSTTVQPNPSYNSRRN